MLQLITTPPKQKPFVITSGSLAMDSEELLLGSVFKALSRPRNSRCLPRVYNSASGGFWGHDLRLRSYYTKFDI